MSSNDFRGTHRQPTSDLIRAAVTATTRCEHSDWSVFAEGSAEHSYGRAGQTTFAAVHVRRPRTASATGKCVNPLGQVRSRWLLLVESIAAPTFFSTFSSSCIVRHRLRWARTLGYVVQHRQELETNLYKSQCRVRRIITRVRLTTLLSSKFGAVFSTM